MTDGLKWYVLELNTSDSFQIYYKRVSSIIPKGCAVLAISKVKYHDYFSTKIDRTVLLTNYIFVLCDLKKHCKSIINSLKTLGIEASVLDGLDGKPLVIDPEDIAKIKSTEKDVVQQNNVDYKPGDFIYATSGPMRGFKGNVSQVTERYVLCTVRVGKIITSVPFIRQDIDKVKLNKEMN